MKSALHTLAKNSHQLHLGIHRHEHMIDWPCSDETIIELYTMLLEPGEHRIYLPNVAAGRELLEPLIASMHFMHEAAIFSVEPGAHQLCSIALYDELIKSGCLLHHADLEDFFGDFLNIDFLWIEETALLRQKPWYHDVIEKLREMHCGLHMSVVIVRIEG